MVSFKRFVDGFQNVSVANAGKLRLKPQRPTHGLMGTEASAEALGHVVPQARSISMSLYLNGNSLAC